MAKITGTVHGDLTIFYDSMSFTNSWNEK